MVFSFDFFDYAHHFLTTEYPISRKQKKKIITRIKYKDEMIKKPGRTLISTRLPKMHVLFAQTLQNQIILRFQVQGIFYGLPFRMGTSKL